MSDAFDIGVRSRRRVDEDLPARVLVEFFDCTEHARTHLRIVKTEKKRTLTPKQRSKLSVGQTPVIGRETGSILETTHGGSVCTQLGASDVPPPATLFSNSRVAAADVVAAAAAVVALL